ncbi:MAG: phosphohistidine phosphatase SixA [Myxococcales bacterium]|nr:phosphohistidine phosphatase SixA [Myxococcales bacterium]
MQVLIVRHGEATNAPAALSDAMRWLTERGRRETRAVGTALRELGLRLEAVYTSPLVRAVQTGELLSAPFSQPDRPIRVCAGLGPEGTTAQALAPLEAHARHASARQAVALVSHEPRVRILVGHLAGRATVPPFAPSTACLVEAAPVAEGEPPVWTARWMLDAATLEPRPLPT